MESFDSALPAQLIDCCLLHSTVSDLKGVDPFQQSQIVDSDLNEIVDMHCQHCISW